MESERKQFEIKEKSFIKSQGGQVGYSPDFHPDGLGLIPARGNQEKRNIKKINK